MNNIILFYGPENEYGCFSNWYLSDFKVENKVFHSGEQWFMYSKAVLFGDDLVADTILNTKLSCVKDNSIVKKYGRQVANFDENIWNLHKENLIYTGLLEKFRQNAELKKILLSTGSSILAEASPYDKIWGIGMRKSDKNAYNMNKWQGENSLGKVLMRVRDTLKVSIN